MVAGSTAAVSELCYDVFAGWSSLVARRAHNPKVVGSNPTPATNPISVGRTPDVRPLLFLWWHEPDRSGCRFCGGPIASGRGRRSLIRIQPPQPIESFRAGGQTPARSFLWPHEPDRSGCRFCGGPITSGRGRRSFPVQTQPPQPIQFPWAGRQMSGPFVSVATRGLQNGLSFWWRTGCIGPGPKVVNRFKSNPRNQSNTSGPETRLRPFASLVA